MMARCAFTKSESSELKEEFRTICQQTLESYTAKHAALRHKLLSDLFFKWALFKAGSDATLYKRDTLDGVGDG